MNRLTWARESFILFFYLNQYIGWGTHIKWATYAWHQRLPNLEVK